MLQSRNPRVTKQTSKIHKIQVHIKKRFIKTAQKEFNYYYNKQFALILCFHFNEILSKQDTVTHNSVIQNDKSFNLVISCYIKQHWLVLWLFSSVIFNYLYVCISVTLKINPHQYRVQQHCIPYTVIQCRLYTAVISVQTHAAL